MNRGVILVLAAGLWAGRLFADETATSATVFEGNLLRIRVEYLAENFPEQLTLLRPTNKLAGTILDLRFADGDSRAVEPAAKLLSDPKASLVILVNGQTRGAAADLALRLRALNAGIVIGSTNGAGKVYPDVTVEVSPDEEKAYQDNPYARPAAKPPRALSGTNSLLAFVDHTSEAELVRKRIKDGDDDGTPATPRAEPPQPVIADPALARAVDLLKSLAALHKSRG